MSTIQKEYYVYILSNQHNTTLYVGVTNNVQRRVQQHRSGFGSAFEHKYKTYKLVYFETTNSILTAIEREKQLKAGSRVKKIQLVNSMNPEWKDLYDEFII